MVAKKRTKRVVSTDIHEKIDPLTEDTMVVETITTTTTTTTKKRIYVKDSNIDLTNIQSLLDDKTDTYPLSAIANTMSNHSCQLTNGSNKKQIESKRFENSANASHSPLSSTKVSNEYQSDEENDPLITVDKKNIYPATKRSENLTKISDHKVKSPNLSCIPSHQNKHLSKARRAKGLKKKTKAISAKTMPKTPTKYKEQRIEDLISQYISVGPVEHKSKGQSHSNNIPDATIDNHNLSDIAEASFEASDAAGNSFDECGFACAENDDLSSIVQNASPIKLGNEKSEFNTENTETNSQKISKKTPATKSQREKRGKYTTKLKSQSGSTENDELESDKTVETVKSVPIPGKKVRKIFEEETKQDAMAPNKKKTKKVTKQIAVIEEQLTTEHTEPIEAEQIETIEGNKRPREQPVARNKRSRAENTKRAEQTKSTNVAERISETTQQQFKSNKRTSKRTRALSMQQTVRRASMEKLNAKEIKQTKTPKPSKSKKLPKTKTDEFSIDVPPPQVDELQDIPMNDEPETPINKNLFDHRIEIYSPSSRKNFKTDSDSNVIIPEALIKSKLMKLSNAPDEWMNKYNGRKEYKMNASHRLRLLLPDTTENVELNTNAKDGGGDILSRIGKLRQPILVREFGTPISK